MSDRTPVVNLRDKPEPPYVRIDRQTKYGNVFRMAKEADREQVIERYRAHLIGSIIAGDITMQEISELAGQRLACWCTPKPCHGDVLAEFADRLFAHETDFLERNT